LNPHKACYLLPIRLPILRINLKRRRGADRLKEGPRGKFSNLGETYFESVFEGRKGPVLLSRTYPLIYRIGANISASVAESGIGRRVSF